MKYSQLLSTNGYIIFNKHLARLIGFEEAIMVGLLCAKYDFYKQSEKLTMIDGEEFFYCTRDWIEQETAIKEDRQRRIMKRLESLNILIIRKEGMPAKNFYHINENTLDELFSEPAKSQDKSLQRASTSGSKEPAQVVANSHLSNNNTNKKEIINKNKDNVGQSPTISLFKTKNDIVKTKTIDKPLQDIVTEVIDYLNDVLGTKYRSNTPATIKLVSALLKAGYTKEDMKKVIQYKYKEWHKTEMQKYLRPETLFRMSKFEGYLNNAISNTPIKSRNKYNDTDDGRVALQAHRDMSKEQQEKALAKKTDGSYMEF